MNDNKMSADSGSDLLYPECIAFWSALDQGQLMIGSCLACTKQHFYPRPHCPFCGSSRTELVACSGRGTLYSFSISRKSSPVVAPAVVELEEGVRLVSVVTKADLERLAIGGKVIFMPQQHEGRMEIAFTTPAALEAQSYASQATEEATKTFAAPPDFKAPPQAAIIGAGSMGTGIALAMVAAGIQVLLVDREASNLAAAIARSRKLHDGDLKRGHLSQAQVEARLALISTTTDFSEIADADVVVEAVWEQLELKRSVFEQIDRFAKQGAIIGTNTSGLDINLLADVTRRPADVVGLHFFSPAHVMKLLEVVRGRHTSDATLAYAFELSRLLSKIPVLVESAPGFAGNRVMRRRELECRSMLHEGASPEQIDTVLKRFGMSMGPYEISDMAGGIELHYRKSLDNGDTYWLNQEMFRLGRLGQKTGKGYYRYEANSRTPKPDLEMAQLLEEASRRAGLVRRRFTDDEVLDRALMAMINEGARVVEEGVVRKPSDLDAAMLHGYGWPRWRGGLLYTADQLGIDHVVERLRKLHGEHGSRFAPSQQILTLAEGGTKFSDIAERSHRAAAFT